MTGHETACRLCDRVALPGLSWCCDHLWNSNDDFEKVAAALELIIDGKVLGASTTQRLDALDLVGMMAGLTPAKRR
ncbi:MAG: hypothetical protein ACTHM9_12105 [Gemmatimonadales bacterium]